eukprot:TRINITY_DN50319_c0_g1_i1.p2 TRINITY_DN50319_c0_g1~~TRINITY_DN50319_c0_g1_i1.p2  ORF type:complete len:169 (+),score=60.14 TRINITY_DN50319_c0_g1_i1:180-686(+)
MEQQPPSQKPKAEGPAVSVEELVAMGVAPKKAAETVKNLPMCKRIAGIKHTAEQHGAISEGLGKMLFDLATKLKNPETPANTLQAVVEFMCNGGISSQEQSAAAEKLLNGAKDEISRAELETACGVGITVTEAQVRATIDELFVAKACLLYTSPSPRDRTRSRMPSSA